MNDTVNYTGCNGKSQDTGKFFSKPRTVPNIESVPHTGFGYASARGNPEK